ncbi:MAG: tetratricopeptide repeat protein [Cyanobacteriota bacterium]|nr:tetratricopeptide repeat protein [Cyanobacteriota bacterium]
MNVDATPGAARPLENLNTDSGTQEKKSADARAFLERAELYYARGNWAEAIATCQKAVNSEPNWAPAFVTWANALQAQGKIKEAMELYSRALEINPNLAEARANLGSMFYRLGRLDEAIVSYEKALSLQPEMAEVYWNLARVFRRQGKLTETNNYEQKAFAINPQLGGAKFHLKRGEKLAKKGDIEGAIAAWQKAIEIEPDLAEAYGKIGSVLKHKGNFVEAIPLLQKAIELKPDCGTAYQHLCAIARDTGNYAAARQAVNQYSHNCAETNQILTAISSISIYQVSGLNDIAKDRFIELESKLLQDFNSVKSEGEIKSLYADFSSAAPYLRDDIEANSRLYRMVGNGYRDRFLKPNYSQAKIEVKQGSLDKRKLKIGFLSNGFQRDSIGWRSADIIRELSQLNTEIYLYTTAELKTDDLTNKISQAAIKLEQPKKYPNGRADAEEIAAAIRQDGVDILLDLDSFCQSINADILYQKPAPVCLSCFGFEPPYISEENYFLGDRHTNPPEREKYYAEKLLRMPDSFVAVSGFQRLVRKRDALRKSHRIGLDQIVYLSLAPGKKFNRDLVKAQIAILKEVPNSVLVSKANGDLEVFQAAYKKACEQRDIGIHRVKIMPPTATEEEHRVIYSWADVMLDSYPYNGCTNTLEALWFNLPVVTRSGEQFSSRMGYSFLQSLGIETGISKTWEEYVNWGVKLGKDASLRQEVVENLEKSKRSESLAPLWDAKKFAKDLSDILMKLLAKKND